MTFLLYVICILICGFASGNAELTSNRNEDILNNDISDISGVSKHVKLPMFNHAGHRKHKKLEWWQKCIVYELYPRSFKDSTGNGIGDLRGIIEKIPYLKDLGIGAIWFTPIFTSPGYDMGYDITDYRGIDELMGTMADFDEMLEKLHENGIRVLLDMVPNHTSDEHEWFVKSVQKIEPYTDYFVWVDAKYVNGTRQVPNNWISKFGGSIWDWNDQRQQYYLHQFYHKQPDLNFRNPLVREEMKNVLRFWMDKGVDGFRFDATSRLFEREDLQDAPLLKDNTQQSYGYMECIDETFQEVQAWRAVVDEYKRKDGVPRIVVMESFLTVEFENKFYGNLTHPGCHFPLSLTLLALPHEPAKRYVDKISTYLENLPLNGWPSWTVGNHDLTRQATKFGEEITDGIRMIQMLLPGTPVNYMADEYGMPDTYVRDDQVFDKMSKVGLKTREKNRTPFQWDSTAQAGFSNKTKTWLPVNPNYVTLNVESQTKDERSHLNIFKELMKLRQLEVFQTGDLNLYEVSEYVFAFSRSNGILNSYFVVVNVGSEMENVNLKRVKRMLPPKMTVRIASLLAEQSAGDIIHTKSFTLRPNAALVLESSVGF